MKPSTVLPSLVDHGCRTLFVLSTMIALIMADLAHASFLESQEWDQQLNELVQSGDGPGLIKFALEIEAFGWTDKDLNVRAGLIWRLSAALNSDAGLAERLVMPVLEKADQLSVQNEAKLVETLMSFPTNPQRFPEVRNLRLRTCLHLWKRVHREIDPNWNPNQKLSRSAPVPEGYDSGISPTAIKDPAIRAEYEAAIEKHRQSLLNFSAQKELHSINQTVAAEVLEYVRQLCSIPPFESDSVASIVNSYVVDERKRHHILGLPE